jgi:hypothetical protein
MLPERAVVDLLGIRLSSIEGAAFAPGQGDECFYQYATVNGATFQLRSQAYCITEGQSNQSALAYWDTTKRRSEPLTSSVKGARVYTQVTEFYPETVVAAATAQCVIEIGMPVADAPNAPPVNGGPDTVLVRALELAYNNFVNQNMTPAE